MGRGEEEGALVGLRCEAVEDTASAVHRAVETAQERSLVFVTGSLYVAGAARDSYEANR